MNKKILYPLCLLSLCRLSTGYAQDQTSAGDLEKQVIEGALNRGSEKIYVHLDRPTYLVGETAWFKISLTDEKLRPSDLSSIAYLEFIGADQRAAIQEKIELKNGKGSGAVPIPADLPSGYYQVRSYTNWMKNFAHSFETTVCIINPFQPRDPSPPETREEKTVDVRFFPEGGQALTGLPHKYAFKAQQNDGTGIDFKGRIVDETGKVVARFAPLLHGIGHFIFQPEAAKTYHAEVALENGSTQRFPLEAAANEGYATRLTEQPAQLELTVNLRNRPDRSLYLLLYDAEKSKAFQANTNNGKAGFTIPKSVLRPGVNVLVLLDESLKPVSERLYFNESTQASVLPKPASTRFKKRSHVTLALESVQTSDTLEASVAVFLSDSLPESAPLSINAYLLLTSELKGYIEGPDDYFDPTQPRLAEARDNLMLTHGWRRYRPEDLLAKNLEAAYLPELEGHLIRGRVFSAGNGAPLANRAVFAAYPTASPMPWVAITDDNGRFLLETGRFYGPRELVVQANYRLDSTARISLENPFLEPGNIRNRTFSLPATANSDLLKRSINMQTQNSYFPYKRAPIQPDSSTFYGRPDYRYYLDDYTRFPTVEEVFREYVPAVNVRIKNGRFYSRIIETGFHKQYFTEDPLILLDGIPVIESDPLFRMDPLKIKRADVINRMYYLGPLAFPGIISCHTYTNDLSGFEIDSKALIVAYKGAMEKREFFNPRYENPSKNSLRRPDFRNLLYWGPSVTIVPGQPAQLDFFTSDQAGRYKIVVQAISPNGTTASGFSQFETVD